MTRFLLGVVFCLSLFGLLGPARADTIKDVQALYDAGNYDAAATMGEDVATADAYALAARSLLGKINLLPRKERKMADINEAIALAEKALELDPDNIEAHLQIATGYGFKARMISMFRAQLAGLPEKSEEHLKTVVELQPDNAWGWAFLGAWHWEVVRKGGAGMARSMFGATMEEGSTDFEKAMSLDENNPVVPYLYALTLLTSNIYDNKDKALSLLDKATEPEVMSHQALAIQDRAATLIRALEANDYQKALGLVAEYQGLKPLKLPAH